MRFLLLESPMKPKLFCKKITRLVVAGGYMRREIAVVANCATGTISNVPKRMLSSGIDDIASSMSASAARSTTPCAAGEMLGVFCRPAGSKTGGQ